MSRWSLQQGEEFRYVQNWGQHPGLPSLSTTLFPWDHPYHRRPGAAADIHHLQKGLEATPGLRDTHWPLRSNGYSNITSSRPCPPVAMGAQQDRMWTGEPMGETWAWLLRERHRPMATGITLKLRRDRKGRGRKAGKRKHAIGKAGEQNGIWVQKG